MKVGEYPATIARQYGMTTAELLAINNITDPRKMQIGQQLKVNSGSEMTRASSTIKVAPVPVVSKPVKIDPPKATTVSSDNTTKVDDAPVEIRVIEADPLIESEDFDTGTDSIFEDAVEIPVIRMEE